MRCYIEKVQGRRKGGVGGVGLPPPPFLFFGGGHRDQCNKQIKRSHLRRPSGSRLAVGTFKEAALLPEVLIGEKNM